MKRKKHDVFAVWLGSLIFVFLLGVTLTFAFAAPGSSPPLGSGAISAAANGNVGIGLTTGVAPAQKLDVNGNIKASGLCIGGICN